MPYDIFAQIYPHLFARWRNGDGVVNRKPGVRPGQYFPCKVTVEQVPVNKQFYQSPPENLGAVKDRCGYKAEGSEYSYIIDRVNTAVQLLP